MSNWSCVMGGWKPAGRFGQGGASLLLRCLLCCLEYAVVLDSPRLASWRCCRKDTDPLSRRKYASALRGRCLDTVSIYQRSPVETHNSIAASTRQDAPTESLSTRKGLSRSTRAPSHHPNHTTTATAYLSHIEHTQSNLRDPPPCLQPYASKPRPSTRALARSPARPRASRPRSTTPGPRSPSPSAPGMARGRSRWRTRRPRRSRSCRRRICGSLSPGRACMGWWSWDRRGGRRLK